MNRVRGYPRGSRVFGAKDFVDLGSRAAIDQSLSRLVRAGKLRRVRRGLYDLPAANPLLKGPSPANTNAVIAAVSRHRGLTATRDNVAAANRMGLTNAVPAQLVYLIDGPSFTLPVDGRKIRLKRASRYLLPWKNSPAKPVVQALLWLGKDLAAAPDTIGILRGSLSDDVKQELVRGKASLPWWAIGAVDAIANENPRIRDVSSAE